MGNNVWIRPLANSGAALVSIGALVIAAPIANPHNGANRAATSPAYALISHDDRDEWVNGVYVGDRYDDDDDYRGGGGVGNFIASFLANNQDQVLAVTAMIPIFYLGPVAVGNSLLANAYYYGYEGSAAGGEGVVAYVTSQLGLQAAPAAAVAATVDAPAAGESDPTPALVSRSAAAAQEARETVAGDGPAAVDSTDADPSDAVAVSVRADVAPAAAGSSARTGEAGEAGDTEDSARSAGRGDVAAKAAGGARSVKARQGRSAAARSGGGDS